MKKITFLSLLALTTIISTSQSEAFWGSDNEKERSGNRMERRERPSKEEIIAKFDVDGDGELSDSEKETMKASRQERGERSDEDDSSEGRGRRERPSKEEMIAKFDTDGDGELSKEERKAARASRPERGERSDEDDSSEGRGRRQGGRRNRR